MKYTLLLALIFFLPVNKTAAEEIKTQEEAPKFVYPVKTFPLPGGLDNILFFNSNSPEMVTSEGILLSTFPPGNKAHPEAHLNRTFQGRFAIFTHHITPKTNIRTLYQGIVMGNNTAKPIKLKVLASSTYLTREAPYKSLPDLISNNEGDTYGGPGDRVSQDIVRDNNLKIFRENSIITIAPNQTLVFLNLPLVAGNERTCQFKLESDGPLYLADLARYDNGFLWWPGKPPQPSDWVNLLENGRLADKRDNIPTPVDKPLAKGQKFIYGRVSGVSTGSTWKADIVNRADRFNIGDIGAGAAYVLNTMHNNTLGTNQVQTAVMENRYPDTGYYSNGNYGVTYDITIPLYNNTNEYKETYLSFDTPVRLPEGTLQKELEYYKDPPEKIFFRGEFKLNYQSYFGYQKEKYFHVVQRSGQKGENLLSLILAPGELRPVRLRYVYPADATAPHVLMITTAPFS